MEDTITLRKKSDGWVATWSGPEARRIHTLFGSTTIPTAFTVEAKAAEVLQRIQELNPGHEVRLDNEPFCEP